MIDSEFNLRFGLGLLDDKRPLDECVLDYVSRVEQRHWKERQHYKKIIDDLRKEKSKLDSAHIDHLYNEEIVNKTWGIIGNFNRAHLELPEAVREKIRDLTWQARENKTE